MKSILLWDPRFPDRAPTRLLLPDAIASAAVRAGIAAAADPKDAGTLSAGGPLDPATLTPVLLQEGTVGDRLARVALPISVVTVGAALGVVALVASAITAPLPIVASVFGRGIWNDLATWSDTDTWKDAA